MQTTALSYRRGTRPGPAALDLVALSRRGLIEADLLTLPGERYATAHLAALRAAAAVLAARARPATSRPGRPRRPASAWVLLTEVAPELTEWSAFFAAGAGKRAAAEAGLSRAVTAREADDLRRDAETFLAVVETTLGLSHQAVLSATGSD
jgi:SAV_6107-like HEPN